MPAFLKIVVNFPLCSVLQARDVRPIDSEEAITGLNPGSGSRRICSHVADKYWTLRLAAYDIGSDSVPSFKMLALRNETCSAEQ